VLKKRRWNKQGIFYNQRFITIDVRNIFLTTNASILVSAPFTQETQESQVIQSFMCAYRGMGAKISHSFEKLLCEKPVANTCKEITSFKVIN
jgi:hypothetical protein